MNLSILTIAHTYNCILTVAEAIEAWNYGCYVAMDAAVGRLLAGFVFQILIAQLQARELYVRCLVLIDAVIFSYRANGANVA